MLLKKLHISFPWKRTTQKLPLICCFWRKKRKKKPYRNYKPFKSSHNTFTNSILLKLPQNEIMHLYCHLRGKHNRSPLSPYLHLLLFFSSLLLFLLFSVFLAFYFSFLYISPLLFLCIITTTYFVVAGQGLSLLLLKVPQFSLSPSFPLHCHHSTNPTESPVII